MPRDVRTPVRNNTRKPRRARRKPAPRPRVDRGSIEYQRAHRPAPSKGNVQARKRMVKARPKEQAGAGLQTGRGKQPRKPAKNTNDPFKGTTKRPLANLEKALSKADRKVYKAAIRLPEKAKYRELERLYAGQVRRKRERILEDSPDEIRKRYGLKPKDKDTHVLGVNVEGIGRGYQKRVNRGAARLKGLIDASNRSSKYGTANITGGDVLARGGKDVIDVFAQAPASAYYAGAAGAEAAQGRPQRGKKLLKEFKEHDPIYLAATGEFKKAGKEISRHPGFAAMELAGGAGTVSRAAGTVGRSGALGKRAKASTSTRRPSKTAPGTSVENPQRYAQGVVGKAAQRTVEKVQVRKAKRLYKDAMQANRRGDTQEGSDLRAKAQKANPLRVSENELRTRYDRREGLAEPRRRAHRTEALREVDEALPDKNVPTALLLSQNMVRPTKKSVQSYLGSLDAQHKGLRSKSEKITNERLRKGMRKDVQDPKLNLPELEKAGRAYAQVTGKRQKEMVEREILPKQAERMAKLIPVAKREMGATWNKDLGRLELGGEKLPVQRIEKFLRRTGRKPEDTAFVTQHPSALGAGAYYQSWQSPKGVSSKSRTGAATERGTFSADRETARANVAKMQGLIDASREFEGFVKEFGYRQKKEVKTYVNRDDAVKEKDRLEAGGSQYEWQPVAVKPMFGGDRQARKLLDNVNADLPKAAREATEAALRGESGAPSYALVPKAVANQMRDHMGVIDPTPGGKALRAGTQQFKNVVLTTSGTGWPTGNVVEASLRSLVDRAGPRSYLLGKKTIQETRKLDPAMGEELVHRIGEGHFGMQELQAIHTTAKSFRGTRFEGVAKAMGTLRRTPGPKQAADLWGAYTRFIFGANGLVEKQFKTAMLGAHVRRELIDRKGIVNLERAAQQAARGLKGTNAQFRAAEDIARAYGRYEGFSPSGRRIKAQYTPFAAWTVNATKFLLQVLPRDHPTVTALLAANQRATEGWQKEVGLDKVPGWLKGSVPEKDGGWRRPGKYTPFSLAQDPIGSAGQVVLPQMQGLLMNAHGLDWKGAPLAGKHLVSQVTDEDKAKAMALTLFGEAVPFWGLGERAIKKGPDALNPVAKIKGQQKSEKKEGGFFDEKPSTKKKGFFD